MFNAKINWIVIFFFCFTLTACSKQLNDAEIRTLSDAVERKFSATIQAFESNGIESATQCCSKKNEIITQSGTFLIVCTVVADFYRPSDKITSKGNDTILPISVYSNAEHMLKGDLKIRDVSITAFAQKKDIYFNQLFVKSINFK